MGGEKSKKKRNCVQYYSKTSINVKSLNVEFLICTSERETNSNTKTQKQPFFSTKTIKQKQINVIFCSDEEVKSHF